MDERDEVMSVVKAFKLLSIIGEEKHIGLTALTKKSGLKKATVFRLLETIKNIGFLDQDLATQEYYLTLQVVTLANQVLENIDLRKLSRPLIEEYATNYGKTITVSILNRNKIVSIDRAYGTEHYRVRDSSGDQLPAHCAASGKAVMAYLPPDKRRLLVGNEPFKAFTPNTIKDYKSLEKDLDAVRQRGFAIDNNERFEEIVGVSTPIFNHERKPVGAVTTLFIATGIEISSITESGNLMIELSRKISSKMGWDGIFPNFL